LSVLTVEEVRGAYLDRNSLSEAHAESIAALKSSPIVVEWPNPATDRRWRLRSNGWVGTFKVAHDLVVRVVPKLPIRNVLDLLVYVGRLEALDEKEVLNSSDSLDDALRTAARSLGRRVERRLGLGLCRRYVDEESKGTRVIGRLLLRPTMRDFALGKVRLTSQLRSLRVDVVENQLLLHALSTAAAAGVLTGEDGLRGILRELQVHLTPVRFPPDAYLGRQYGRWESDYQSMHRLGALIVSLSGAGSGSGTAAAEAIAVYMPELFETVVSTALRSAIPPNVRVAAWHKLRFPGAGNVVFEPDFVLFDKSGRARLVIDAKYKGSGGPDTSDVQQVVAYAGALHCTEAILVYPQPLDASLDISVGHVRVRSAFVDLAATIEDAPRHLISLVTSLLEIPLYERAG
jgi:5-methylcytosine-specific restriction enzyme subunit McrC